MTQIHKNARTGNDALARVKREEWHGQLRDRWPHLMAWTYARLTRELSDFQAFYYEQALILELETRDKKGRKGPWKV